MAKRKQRDDDGKVPVIMQSALTYGGILYLTGDLVRMTPADARDYLALCWCKPAPVEVAT